MTGNLKKFLELACAEGREYVKRLQSADRDGIIALAAEKGIELTEADFAQPDAEGEVSLDEADGVAGGDTCFCVVGGGGESNGMGDGVCACVGYGQGNSEWSDLERCICVLGGSGFDVLGDN